MFCFDVCVQTMSSQRRAACRRSSTRAACDEVAGRSSLSAADDDDDEVWSLSRPAQRTPEAGGTWTSLVSVDVTGAAFQRQCAYLQSRRPTSQLPGVDSGDDDDHSRELVDRLTNASETT